MRAENEALGLSADAEDVDGDDDDVGISDLAGAEDEDDASEGTPPPTKEPSATATPVVTSQVLEQEAPEADDGPSESKGTAKRRKRKTKSRVGSGLATPDATPPIAKRPELKEDEDAAQTDLVSQLQTTNLADGGKTQPWSSLSVTDDLTGSCIIDDKAGDQATPGTQQAAERSKREKRRVKEAAKKAGQTSTDVPQVIEPL